MEIVTVTNDNFEQEVLACEVPVILDFWADWCGPCRKVGLVLEVIARERPDIKVGKINVDEQPELAARFNISNIPTLLVVKEGKITNMQVGARPKADILRML